MANERLTLQIDTVTTGTQQVDALTASLNKVVSIADRTGKSLQSSGAGNPFANYPGLIKQSLTDPLGAAESAVTRFTSSLSGINPVIGGVAAGLLGIGASSLLATRSLAALGVETQAMSLKTGLTTKEVGAFSFAAKAAGSDVSIFQTAMRKLSDGLVDGGQEGKKAADALRSLGVQSRTAGGDIRPIGEIFDAIGTSLAKVDSPAQRAKLAIDLFGRSGVELIPTLLSLSQRVKEFGALGGGLSDADVAKYTAWNTQLAEVGVKWDLLVRKAKEGIAGTFTLNFVNGTLDFLSGAQKGGNAPGSSITAVPRQIAGGIAEFALRHPINPGLNIYGTAEASLSSKVGLQSSLLLPSEAGGDAIANRIARNESSTPAGIQAQLTKLNEDRSNLVAASRPGQGVGLDAQRENETKLKALDAQIAGLTERQKLLAQEEAKYVASLEKIRSLNDAGTPFYIINPGKKQTITSSQDIADSLTKGRRATPSLYRGGEYQPPEAGPFQNLGGDIPAGNQFLGGSGLSFVVNSQEQDRSGRAVMAEVLRGMDEFQRRWNDDTRKQNEANLTGINDRGERQSRLVAIGAQPGDELTVAAKQLSIRMATLDQERKIIEANSDLYDMTEERYKLDKQAQDATLDYLAALRENQAHQAETLRNFSGGLFDAIAGRQPRAVPNFLKDQVLGQARTVTENLAQTYLLPTLQSASSTFGVSGSLAKGTWFAKSQDKTAPIIGAIGSVRDEVAKVVAAITGKADPSVPGSASVLGSIAPGSVAGSLSTLSDIGDGLPMSSGAYGATATAAAMRAMSLSSSSGGGGLAPVLGGFTRGLSSLASGNSLNILFGNNPTPTPTFAGIGPDGLPVMGSGGLGTGLGQATALGSPSLSTQIGAGVALAGGIAAGAYGVMSGLKQGGVGGDLKAAGSAVGLTTGIVANVAKLIGAASPLLSAIPIVGSLVSAALPLIGSFFNGPQVRANQINTELGSAQYIAPQALNVTQSSNGTFTDFNAKGALRGSSFSAIPTVRQGSIWESTHGLFGGPPTFYNVPGGQTSQFGAPVTPPVVNNHYYSVSTMDAASFNDFAQKNHMAIGNAAATNLQQVHGRLSTEVQRTVNG